MEFGETLQRLLWFLIFSPLLLCFAKWMQMYLNLYLIFMQAIMRMCTQWSVPFWALGLISPLEDCRLLDVLSVLMFEQVYCPAVLIQNPINIRHFWRTLHSGPAVLLISKRFVALRELESTETQRLKRLMALLVEYGHLLWQDHFWSDPVKSFLLMVFRNLSVLPFEMENPHSCQGFISLDWSRISSNDMSQTRYSFGVSPNDKKWFDSKVPEINFRFRLLSPLLYIYPDASLMIPGAWSLVSLFFVLGSLSCFHYLMLCSSLRDGGYTRSIPYDPN